MRTEIRIIGPISGLGDAPGVAPKQGCMGMALGPQCLVDHVTLMRNGIPGPGEAIVLAPGVPYIGKLDDSILSIARAIDDPGGGLVQARRYDIPTTIAAGMVWNGRRVEGLATIPVEIALFYGTPPPTVAVRRAPFTGHVPNADSDECDFPVFGRSRISVSLILSAGTSVDYAIRGLDQVPDVSGSNTFAGNDTNIASGTLTAGGTEEFLWGYDGSPYEWLRVSISNPQGGGTAHVYVHAYDD